MPINTLSYFYRITVTRFVYSILYRAAGLNWRGVTPTVDPCSRYMSNWEGRATKLKVIVFEVWRHLEFDGTFP